MKKTELNTDCEEFNIQNHEFVPPEENRSESRRILPKGKAFAAAALLTVLLIFSALPGADSPPKTNVRYKAPKCRIYPVRMEYELTGMAHLTNADHLTKAVLSVWEKTQNRQIYEEELPVEDMHNGNLYFPLWNLRSDFMEHREEYTGFEGKGDYKQQVRLSITYETGKGETKTVVYAADPAANDLCWLKQASKKHGALFVKEGYITEIIHTAQLGSDIDACYIEEPGKVTKPSRISIRVTIDGEEPDQKPYIENPRGNIYVLNIPVPEGVSADKSHRINIYITQYIFEYGRAIELLHTDEY